MIALHPASPADIAEPAPSAPRRWPTLEDIRRRFPLDEEMLWQRLNQPRMTRREALLQLQTMMPLSKHALEELQRSEEG